MTGKCLGYIEITWHALSSIYSLPFPPHSSSCMCMHGVVYVLCVLVCACVYIRTCTWGNACVCIQVLCLHTIWNGVCVRAYACVCTWSGWSQLVTKNGWVLTLDSDHVMLLFDYDHEWTSADPPCYCCGDCMLSQASYLLYMKLTIYGHGCYCLALHYCFYITVAGGHMDWGSIIPSFFRLPFPNICKFGTAAGMYMHGSLSLETLFFVVSQL